MSTKSLAINLFNETWDLMVKEERTPEENALMLHKAHSSCYLWSLEGNPVNDARGEWQVARVYSLLGIGALALLHARRSLDLCLDNGIGDFDLAFGYEAVARAFALVGDADQAAEYREKALEAADGVEEDDDREYVIREVGGIAI
jgi:hypothetical protein